MQSTIAMRSYLMAGVAVAGAGIIAVNPVQPVALSTAPMVKSEVALAAAQGSLIGLVQANEICDTSWKCSDPAEIYAAVWNNFVTGTTATWNQFLASPSIIGTVLKNLEFYAKYSGPAILGTINSELKAIFQEAPAYAWAGVQDLFKLNLLGASNNFTLALNAPLIPLPPLIENLAQVTVNPLYNIGNIIQNITKTQAVGNAVYGLLGPLISGAGGIFAVTQNIIDSIKAGSWEDAFNWAINIPAIVFDGFVNGGYGPVLYKVPSADPNLPYSVVAGGLLNPQKILEVPGIRQITSPGSVSSLIIERGYVTKGLCPTGGCVNPIPNPAAVTPAAAAVAPAAAAAVAAPEAPAAPKVEAPAAVTLDAPAAEPEAPKVEAPAAEVDAPKVEIPAELAADSTPAAPEAAADVVRGAAAEATAGDDAGSSAPAAATRGHRGPRG